MATDALAVRLPSCIDSSPHPPQHAFLALTCREAFYGGAAGGGKSEALLMAALQYVDVPGYAALIVRKTFSHLSLSGALLDRAKDWLLGRPDVAWSEQKKRFTFASGATLEFGFLQYGRDKYRYQGADFQCICFDELTQFDEADYLYLFSRLRKPAAGPLAQVPLRMRAASNPGGLGHVWVRNRFIKRLPSAENEPPPPIGERVFVPAKLPDNPSLDMASYLPSLGELDAQTKRQLLDGDWDARSPGTCFNEFVWDAHTVEGTRSPDNPFPVYRCIDFGLNHAVCLWIEVQGDRMAFVFCELHSQGKNLHAFCEDILTTDQDLDVDSDVTTYVDPAGMARSPQTGVRDTEVLASFGIQVGNFAKGDTYSRESRTSLIKRLLEQQALWVSRDECPYLIDAFENAQWDRVGTDGALKDCYKKDGVWDHALDALGEGLVRIFTPNVASAADTIDVMHAQYSSSGYG